MDINKAFLKFNSDPGAPKVLFFPINTCHTDFCEAFAANGFEVYSFNFAGDWNHKEYMSKHKPTVEKVFLDTCARINPELVFTTIDRGNFICPSTFIEAKRVSPGTTFINYTGDVREKPGRGLVKIGKIVDITLIVNTGQIDLFKKYGVKRVEYLQAGVRPCFFPLPGSERYSLRQKLQHDIVFCANNELAFPGAALRNEVVEKLCKAFGDRFVVYGKGWKKNCRQQSEYDKQQEIYNGSKIVISINNYNDIEMYFSARQLNAMATSTLTISKYIPGLEKYFENKKDIVWFNSADECVELVNYYLEHEDEARQIGISGSEKVLTYHTKAARIIELKEILKI